MLQHLAEAVRHCQCRRHCRLPFLSSGMFRCFSVQGASAGQEGIPSLEDHQKGSLLNGNTPVASQLCPDRQHSFI